MDSDDSVRLAQTLERKIAQSAPDVAGPVRVADSSPAGADATEYSVSASRLVPLDSTDPKLASIYVPVPVTGHVTMTSDGSATTQLDPVDESAAREARAWARNLLATGAVAGVTATAPSYGPPVRPTHELVEDENGRRVVRRTGFSLR